MVIMRKNNGADPFELYLLSLGQRVLMESKRILGFEGGLLMARGSKNKSMLTPLVSMVIEAPGRVGSAANNERYRRMA